MLATTAATPVGGDDLEVAIDVGPAASARIGSVAAMQVWPAPDGRPSVMRTTATVGSGGRLVLAPEPTITVAGSVHRSVTRIELAAGATCRIAEEFSLGRSGEPAGTVETSLRVVRDGVALVHHDEVLGAASSTAGTSVGVGAARHVIAVVIVGDLAADAVGVGPATEVGSTGAGARLPLAADAWLVLAAGIDRPSTRVLVDALVADVHAPSSGSSAMVRPSDQTLPSEVTRC